MTEIIPGLLWIGNAGQVRDLSAVLDAGIEALVDLAWEEPPARITRDVIYCRFPLLDGAENPPSRLRAAIETVVSLLEKRVPTLVFCGAGMSRSPAVVAAALAVSRGDGLDETLSGVVAGHPHDVSAALWEEIRMVCKA